MRCKCYQGHEIAEFLVKNKIQNQREVLNKLRGKSVACKEVIAKLDLYLAQLAEGTLGEKSLLGLEGAASRIYFPQMFNQTNWQGRKPRIKSDYVKATLDIGYNLLFNFQFRLGCYLSQNLTFSQLLLGRVSCFLY